MPEYAKDKSEQGAESWHDGGIGEPVVALACGKARAKRAVLAHTAVGTQARSSRECWYKSDPYTFLWADIYS